MDVLHLCRSPLCKASLGNGSSTSTATEAIEGFGVIAIQSLLEYEGLPDAAVDGITGMLLTGGSTGSPSDSALEAVSEQLAVFN